VRPVIPALQACALAHTEIALILNEAPVSSPSIGQADLIILLGPETRSTQFTIPLAWEEIVVIVHQDNPIDQLDKDQLHAIFTGAIRQWGGLQLPEGQAAEAIEAWGFPPENEVRDIFDGVIFGEQRPPNLILRLAPDPPAMIEAVARSKEAIGYVPKAWLSAEEYVPAVNQVRTISLPVPLLAAADSEVEGLPRTMLECLQSGVGQETLTSLYRPWESK
jgi:hypothetical protein